MAAAPVGAVETSSLVGVAARESDTSYAGGGIASVYAASASAEHTLVITKEVMLSSVPGSEFV